jgi:hypothetical protein
MEEKSPIMQDVCRYVEQIAADSRQVVVFTIGNWEGTRSIIIISVLPNLTMDLKQAIKKA